MSQEAPFQPPLSLDAYVTLLTDDLRRDHPGIVEEWEQQREDALETDSDEWPDFQTPDGLLWWLYSEVELAREIGRNDKEGADRERAIEEYCLAAVQGLQRVMDKAAEGDANLDI